MAMSFRMTSFAPREAMTTAEPPEPLTFQHQDAIMNKQNLQEIVGPAARLSVKNQCYLCFLWFPYTKKPPFVLRRLWISLAARPGLEPRLNEPESLVLPLHQRAE